jgi:hypothetical protein
VFRLQGIHFLLGLGEASLQFGRLSIMMIIVIIIIVVGWHHNSTAG